MYSMNQLQNTKYILFILIFFLFSCKEEMVEYQTNECKSQPSFIKKFGFNPNQSALATTEKRIPGLVILQMLDSNGVKPKPFQHPSWNLAGNLGPLIIDPFGNVFVAPVPTVNILTNPTEKQNIIYKVDGGTGIMQPFLSLPVPEKLTTINPYGILGLAYLCETNTVYVSSVMGSDRKNETGIIYAINSTNATIVDKISGIDVLGMGISYMSGERRLYFGKARTSDVFSVKLTPNGSFSGKVRFEFSIAGLGTRGDDKVRRIRFDKNGNMLVFTTEFNFNLSAPTEKKEDIFNYMFDNEQNKWVPLP